MREAASVDRVKLGGNEIQHHSLDVLHIYLAVCICEHTVWTCVRLTADMFVFIDSKRRAMAAHTARYGWQGSRLRGNVCV